MKQWILIVTYIKGSKIDHEVLGPFPTLNSAIQQRAKRGGVIKVITFKSSVNF